MTKTILITGATDGIGLETARKLVGQGHTVLLHGRNPKKLEMVAAELSSIADGGSVESYTADLSRFDETAALAKAVAEKHDRLDALINNAGVLKIDDPRTADGLDVRFMVNTIAPYLLTRRLWSLLGAEGRVVNLSSAAQNPVDPKALGGEPQLNDMAAYAQSKLAITMWSRVMAEENGAPVVIAVNPGSLLATKMVKEGFGTAGNDIGIGADILIRAALSDEFADASGKYFDNDAGRFGAPHRDALNAAKSADVMRAIEAVLEEKAT